MYSKIKILGHPLHAMIVPFPVAFYTATMVCYICYSFNNDPFMFRVAVMANCAGISTAALAAIPGFIDWLFIPKEKRAKRVGLLHMLCSIAALTLFGITFFTLCPKLGESQPDDGPAVIMTMAGFILTLVGGFLGWSLVQKHHVGVHLTPEQQKIDPRDGVA